MDGQPFSLRTFEGKIQIGDMNSVIEGEPNMPIGSIFGNSFELRSMHGKWIESLTKKEERGHLSKLFWARSPM